MGCFILISCYKSNLLASMLVVKYERSLHTFKDLLDKGDPVYMPAFTMMPKTLKNSPFEVERKLYQMALDTNSFYKFK